MTYQQQVRLVAAIVLAQLMIEQERTNPEVGANVDHVQEMITKQCIDLLNLPDSPQFEHDVYKELCAQVGEEA